MNYYQTTWNYLQSILIEKNITQEIAYHNHNELITKLNEYTNNFFNTNDIIEATGYELQYDSNMSVIQTAMKYKNKETICDLEIIFVISNDSHKIILQIQKEKELKSIQQIISNHTVPDFLFSYDKTIEVEKLLLLPNQHQITTYKNLVTDELLSIQYQQGIPVWFDNEYLNHFVHVFNQSKQGIEIIFRNKIPVYAQSNDSNYDIKNISLNLEKSNDIQNIIDYIRAELNISLQQAINKKVKTKKHIR